jgi:hypothetical protein
MTEHEWIEGDDSNARRALIAELYPTHSYDEIRKALGERGFSPSRLQHDLRDLKREGKIIRKVPPEMRKGHDKTVTDQPLTDLHFKVLSFLDEFPSGVERPRLQSEVKATTLQVDECLSMLSSLNFIRFDPLVDRWQIMMRGRAALKQPVLVKPPEPKPEEPTTWYPCDYVDERGKKCDKRFASSMGVTVHKAMMHKVKSPSASGGPPLMPKEKFACDVEGCKFVACSMQGLNHHKTSMHGKKAKVKTPSSASPSGTIVPTETTVSIPAPVDAFAGLAKLLAELNAIPGIKVSISISLGVSQ